MVKHQDSGQSQVSESLSASSSAVKIKPIFSFCPFSINCSKNLFQIDYLVTVSSLCVVWGLHSDRGFLRKGQVFKNKKKCPYNSRLLSRALPFGRNVVLPITDTLPSLKDQPQLGPHALFYHRSPLRERRIFRSLQPVTLKQMLIVQG